jgi:hypothetical protein
MSRPYNPDETSLNYIPTQIIAERLRHADADGIAYNSLLSEGGHNLVLFDLRDADPVNFTLYEVEKVSYKVTQRDNTYYARARAFPAKVNDKE